MRRLVVVLVVLGTLCVSAQRNDGARKGKAFKADLTAEQLATLHTKKMTLALDLTQVQQAQVMEINLERAKMRKAKYEKRMAKKESGEWEKPSPDERFEIENERLDYQIAQHQKMKEVLTDNQYQTWKKMTLRKGMNGKKTMQGKQRRG